MNRLIGKKALVTGAARGIGHAIAIAYAKEGADVAILDLKQENAEVTAKEARALGVNSIAVAADVSNEEQVKRAIAEVQKAFGRIDILVNNAGIDTTSTVVEMPTAMWDEMMAVNLRSIFLC
ncbi:MAG: SDR family NAD(P)-dependent oxidoreductase, partial [Betaproteobacteria bacterium]